MRIAVDPICISALELLPVERLCPAVMGRFTVAQPLSVSPPGWKETWPAWWIIKRGGGLENHNEETEQQAYAPAEICKTDRCLHHIAPSGHAFGDPFSSNRHRNVTLGEGVFGNANQATQISASPECSSPSVYATPL